MIHYHGYQLVTSSTNLFTFTLGDLPIKLKLGKYDLGSYLYHVVSGVISLVFVG